MLPDSDEKLAAGRSLRLLRVLGFAVLGFGVCFFCSFMFFFPGGGG